MQINNVLNTGVQGFKGAMSRADQAARKIASQSVAGTRVASDPSSVASLGQGGLVAPMVDLMQAETEAKANAKVIETASEMLGSLLDTTA